MAYALPSHHSGIERKDTDGLKVDADRLPSHHSGIESKFYEAVRGN